MPADRSNAEIVKAGNDLARKFYAAHGYQVPEGYLQYALDELEAEEG